MRKENAKESMIKVLYEHRKELFEALKEDFFTCFGATGTFKEGMRTVAEAFSFKGERLTFKRATSLFLCIMIAVTLIPSVPGSYSAYAEEMEAPIVEEQANIDSQEAAQDVEKTGVVQEELVYATETEETFSDDSWTDENPEEVIIQDENNEKSSIDKENEEGFVEAEGNEDNEEVVKQPKMMLAAAPVLGATKKQAIFDANGGQFSKGETSTAITNDKIYKSDVDDLKPTREGWTFLGWYSDPVGGNEITYPKTEWVVYKYRSLSGTEAWYAHWEIKTYEVKFHEGSKVDTKTVNHAATLTDAVVSEKTYSSNDADFIGWSTSKNTVSIFDLTTPITKDYNLYPVWECTAKFVSSGTDVTYGRTFPAYGDEKAVKQGSTITIPNPSAEGWTFLGWKDENGNSLVGDNYHSNQHTVNKHETWYANWKKDSHSVKFYDNVKYITDIRDKNLWCEPITVEYGTNINLPEPTKSGYKFLGWYVCDGINLLNDKAFDSSTPITEDLILYADWIDVHTITLDANGGHFDFATETTKELASCSEVPDLSTYVPTRDNYLFDGWDPREVGNFRPGADLSKDITFYAQWKNFDIHLYAMEGTFSNGSKWDSVNGVVKVPASLTDLYDSYHKPQRLHYRFAGWKYIVNPGDQQISTGKDASGNDPITNGDIYLAATWEPLEKITFVANLGTFASGTDYDEELNGNITRYVDAKEQTTITDLPEITRSGYEFEGWYFDGWNRDKTTGEITGTKVSETDSLVPGQNLRLYAVWSEKHTVTLNANGGYLSNASETSFSFDASVRVPSSTDFEAHKASRPAYEFLGWSTDTNTVITLSYGNRLLSDLDLYAVWRPYVVRYDADGGQFETGYASVTNVASNTNGGNFVLGTLPKVTKNNYRFDGWFYTSPTSLASSTDILSGDEDVDLIAHWTRLYTLKFYPNGGRFEGLCVASPTDCITKVEPVFPASVTTPTNVGYKFVGWSVYSNATSLASCTNAGTLLSTDTDFYAVWDQLGHTLVFNANGGTFRESGNAVASYTDKKYFSQNICQETPIRDRWKFAGWYKDSACTELFTEASLLITNDEVVNAYAKWINYNITLNANGGTLQNTEINGVVKVPASLTDAYYTPTWQYHRFMGWKYSTNTNAVQVQVGDDIERNTNIYASWEPLEKVTFDPNGGSFTDNSYGFDGTASGTSYKYIDKNKDNIGTLPNVALDDSIFLGWYYKDVNITNTRANNNEAITHDVTLVARWAKEGDVKTKQFTTGTDANLRYVDNTFVLSNVTDGYAVCVLAGNETGYKTRSQAQTALENVEKSIEEKGYASITDAISLSTDAGYNNIASPNAVNFVADIPYGSAEDAYTVNIITNDSENEYNFAYFIEYQLDNGEYSIKLSGKVVHNQKNTKNINESETKVDNTKFATVTDIAGLENTLFADETEKEKNFDNASILTSGTDLAMAVLGNNTEYSGKKIAVWLEVSNAGKADEELVQSKFVSNTDFEGKENAVLRTLDINLFIGETEGEVDSQNMIGVDPVQLHELSNPITITIELNDNDEITAAKNGELLVARIHNGEVDFITPTFSEPNILSFETAKFSEYVLVQSKEIEEQEPVKKHSHFDLDEYVRGLIDSIEFRVNTEATSRGTKAYITWLNGDVAEIEKLGYKVKYKFYRSTSKKGKYTEKLTKENGKYLNTAGTNGKTYFYRAKLVVEDSNGNVVYESKLMNCKYGVREFYKEK